MAEFNGLLARTARARKILARMGLTPLELVDAALQSVEAGWDGYIEAMEDDSSEGKEVTQQERVQIIHAAGKAFTEALLQNMRDDD